MPNGGEREEQARGDLGPLPGGHHGLSPQQVAESQRERLLAATAELIAERGYGPTPITEIAKRASVANRVFYANFATKEEAFIAAFDAVADHLTALVVAAAAAEEEWPRRVVAALRATTVFFDSEPKLARFCFVAPFTATKAIAAHCRDRIGVALPFLAEGRSFGTSGAELPTSTEDSLLGGVVSQLSRSLLGETGPLVALLPDLVEFVLSPYLGTEQARALGAEAAR